MRRESLYPFLPAVLAVVTDAATAAIVRAQQPDYPGRFIAYQIVMFGAALLAAVPNKWVRFVGFAILLAGVVFVMSVGLLYVPTFLAVVWVMVRDERRPVPSGQGGRENETKGSGRQARPAAVHSVHGLMRSTPQCWKSRSEERRVGKECRSRWSP